MNHTLLIELLTEELPPKALARLAEAFSNSIVNSLKSHHFLESDSVTSAYATPRRLAVSITHVRAASPNKIIREKVLPVSVALDKEGKPTIPLLKKLAVLEEASKAFSLNIDQLERAADGKTESFFYTYTAPGSPLQDVLQTILEEAIVELPIPKLMRYQSPDGSTVQFVRPAHRLIVLHGSTVVPIGVLGLVAGRTTLGHRFLAQDEITISTADDYATVLETEGKVIANLETRKKKISAALTALAADDQVLMPEALLDEVTALVEWPVVYACNFEPAFLTVPQECLILTMQTNQKYFALTDKEGKLRSRFLIVSNIETDDPQHIIGGNERVVRPRLSDAKFFFEQDKKKTLISRFDHLDKVVYHNKFEFSSMKNRADRVIELAALISDALNANTEYVKEAATLAKTDLLTDMVGEFPELQGIMGAYYARNEGKHEEVALAISEHYQPRFSGDTLPTTLIGTCVALADKLETLVGIWGIGLHPTGDKDPYALRRHAIGILRILIEKKLLLRLDELLIATRQIILNDKLNRLFNGEQLRAKGTNSVSTIPRGQLEEIQTFCFDRLRGLLRERGYTTNEIEAVVAKQLACLYDIIERLDAVRAFAAMPEAQSLASANKRITNILKKTDGTHTTIHKGLLREMAEEGLYSAMTLLKPQVDAAFARGDFTTALKTLAHLHHNVDSFFNTVMVMSDDEQLRNNRLALLSRLHTMMNQVADISKLAA
jgi:glycyl-tRNA synthetase beta chain